MPARYSPDRVRVLFDKYGAAEWDRFDRSVAGRVSLELHKRFQSRWVHAGDRVLEVGAGPGRFTIELAQLGARILVSDISPRQLDLNRDRVAAAGYEDAVEGRQLLDVTDLSSLERASFDVVTAFGGPLSYVFERAGEALDELLAAVRPGGTVLFSVMSRWGSIHQFLDGVLKEFAQGLKDEYRFLVETGDQFGETGRSSVVGLAHEMHLFTWEELERLLGPRPCQLLDASAANFLSVRADSALSDLDPETWDQFLNWEEAACRDHGALDAGTHIMVAVERQAPTRGGQ
jgi:SAM-dependent methyltransferase